MCQVWYTYSVGSKSSSWIVPQFLNNVSQDFLNFGFLLVAILSLPAPTVGVTEVYL